MSKSKRSLSQYPQGELARMAGKPTMKEWLEPVKRLPPLKEPVDVTSIIREERDRRRGG